MSRPAKSLSAPGAAALAVPITGAGACLLWPLLPPLWRQLQLIGEKTFFDPQARREAASCLDEIVWGGPAPEPSCPALSQLLSQLPWGTPTTPADHDDAARTALASFVASLPQRSPPWAKLSIAEIRTLFLQRRGWLVQDHDTCTLHVEPRPQDALLDRFPWPIERILLPWFERPWAVCWQPPPDTLLAAAH